MTWSAEQQTQYSEALEALISEYSEAFTTWTNSIQDSARDPSLQSYADRAAAQVASVLQKLRVFSKDHQKISSAAIEQGGVLQKLNDLAAQIAEEKTLLAKLRSESGTRHEQTSPKATPSPYINILGLHRTFRESTRFTIMIVSILFGVLGLVLAIYMVYMIYMNRVASPGTTVLPAQQLFGGSRRTHK